MQNYGNQTQAARLLGIKRDSAKKRSPAAGGMSGYFEPNRFAP